MSITRVLGPRNRARAQYRPLCALYGRLPLTAAECPVLYVDRRNTLQPADQITGGQAEDLAPEVPA